MRRSPLRAPGPSSCTEMRSRQPTVDQLALPLPEVTCDLFEAMRWRAGDRCEICRVRAEDVQKRRLHVDHDHRLGTGWDHVRGLLCSRCNNHMKYVDNGYWKPSPEHLRYVANAWFWVLLPAEQIDQPYFPDTCEDPCSTVDYRSTPAYRRRLERVRWAKENDRKLYRKMMRRKRAGLSY